MGTIDLSQYKLLYLETAKKYLTEIDVNLQALGNNASDFATVEHLHIAYHSLKGQSFAMNFSETAQLCFAMEQACKKLRAAATPVTQEQVTTLQTATTKLKEDISTIETAGYECPLAETIQQVKTQFTL